MLRGCVVVGLTLTAGCYVLAGFDAIDPGAAPIGGGGSGGDSDIGGGGGADGVGGHADGGSVGDGGSDGGSGGGEPTSAADWSTEMTALYRFEPSDLSLDSSGQGHTLTASNNPQYDATRVQEGGGSLLVEPGVFEYMSSTAPVFHSPPGVSLTFGGWIRDSSSITGSSYPINRWDTFNGYRLERDGDGNLICFTGGTGTTSTNGGAWAQQQWVHVVCRYNGATSLTAAFNDGTLIDEAGTTEIANATDGEAAAFRIGNTVGNFGGNLDEVFFIDVALSEKSVRRIYACGVDGSLCMCAGNSAAYSDCGRAEPDCTGLIPCNQTAPD